MAKMLRLDRENERALARLNRSLDNAFRLANETLNTLAEVQRLKKCGDEHAAILHALTQLVKLGELSIKVRDDRTRP